jgi:eukaryotic-like serine/threonine-protein kinase
MSIAPGSRIGPYEVVASLGAGGMGEVYRARDPKLGRELALKVLPSDLAASSGQLQRFEQEARSASMLNHPAVVTVYDVGRHEDQPYIAMELVEGETLRRVLEPGPLPLRRALAIATCLAEGLAAAHGKGIVHRDLKPDNVMVLPDGRVKILDFGLAKLTAPEVGPSDQTARHSWRETRPGTILGTIGYMSPEQAAGESADFRSDQFSLGLLLYEMLTGVRPFQRSNTVETLHAIMRDPLPQIGQFNSALPEALVWTLNRLLAKEPAERYASTHDLVRDLQHVAESLSVSGRVGPAAPPPRVTRDRILVAALSVAVLVLVAVAASREFLPKRVPVPDQKSLIVFPFDDLTGADTGELYSRGFAEAVSVRLSSVRGLQVLPPSEAPRAPEPGRSIAAVARASGATLALHGSFQRAGGNVKVNYLLTNAANGVQLAADSVRGPAADIFLLQDQVAESVAAALELQTLGTRRASGLASAADQETYLQALGLLQRYENETAVDRAIDSLEELAQRIDRSALLHAALGRAYVRKHALTSNPVWIDRADAASRRAMSIDANSPEVRITLGELLIARGDYARAAAEFQAVLQWQPGSSEAMLQLGEALDKAGRGEEAERIYRRTIEMNPAWWSAYNRLGTFFFRRGRYGDALPLFRKVLELTPDNVRGLNNLGSTYMQMGRNDEALAAYARSAAVRPNSDALSNQGTLLYFAGRYAEASVAYEKAAALTPGDYLVWANLGDAYRARGGAATRADAAYGRAIALAERALETNENDIAAHSAIALAYAKTGDSERARNHIARTLEGDPDNPISLYVAAIVSNAGGRSGDALKFLSRAVENGFPREQLLNEPEFANLRNEPGFRQLTSGENRSSS